MWAGGRTDRHDEANSRFSPSLQTRVKNVPLKFYVGCCTSLYHTHLRQECHNSKFGIFELFVEKETYADALLTGIVP
jgi:hypothetical protein